MKKQVLAGALAASIAAVAIAGASLAYFTDDDTRTNTYTVGNVTIVLHEDAWDNGGEEEAKDMYPGEKVGKDPVVENTGSNPAFVRVKVTKPDEISFRTDYTMDKIGDNWVYNEDDGYYYYTQILEPGKKTDALFDQIVLSTEATNETKGGDVVVYAEAIQAQGAAEQWERVKAMSVAEISDWFENHNQIPFDPEFA